MTVQEVIALLGLLVAMAGALGLVWRSLAGRIAECHHRINKTRDEYARRDDLMQHMERIERSLDRLHNRMDRALGERPMAGEGE